jgi:hypothetical protein
VIWGILLSSLISTVSFAEDFVQIPLDDAKKMCVALEVGKICTKQVTTLQEANKQIQEQNELLAKQTIILSKNLSLVQEQNVLCADEIEKQKEIYEQKLKVAEVDKPTFFQKVSFGLGSVGIGIVIGVLAALAL